MATQCTLESLPSIPSLPPLEMPESSLSTSNIDPPSLSQSSSISFSSGETATPLPFAPPQDSSIRTHSPELSPSRSSSSSLAPRQGLRKSLSVDSFVQFGRESVSKPGTRPNRVNTESGIDPPRGLVFENPGLRRDREHRAVQRSRGASVSTTGDEFDHSLVGDPDIERSELVSRIGEAGRRGSLKGQEQSKSFIPGGELPLPSRTPTLSSTSSMSSISRISSVTVESAPRLQYASSMQSMSMRATASDRGRTRSGSLGMHMGHTGKRIHINTQVLPYDRFCKNPEVTLVVVGTAGCGKSTVIRKGLKGYDLSQPTTFSAPTGLLGAQALSRYTRRIGRISQNENVLDCPLHIMEVEASTSALDHSTLRGGFWPESAPRVDGALICYDSSDGQSFLPVENLLRGYRDLKLPTVVLACKSDLERRVDPQQALEVIKQYDVGLVEVGVSRESGKDKMRRTFDWLLKAVFRDRRSSRNDFDANYRNPASPDVLMSPPWENSRTTTPTASSSTTSMNTVAQSQGQGALSALQQSRLNSIPPTRTSSGPSSPTRARSTGDLLSEHERYKNLDRQTERDMSASRSLLDVGGISPGSTNAITPGDVLNPPDDVREDQKESKDKDSRPAQWATLEELLDKLLFLAVSGDDSAYITHFLLTYRRFTSPRSVLLAMQKRMRQLDNPSGDPMFACFAQMRICHLLELWVRDYPHDFAVRGTAGALAALVKSVIAKTFLLHYGSDFLPFLEVLPNLVDKDASWAFKVEDIADESDDSADEDEEGTQITEPDSPSSSGLSPMSAKTKSVFSIPISSRERKSSLPLTVKSLVMPNQTPSISSGQSDADVPPKQMIKDLLRVAQELQALDSEEIAQEITRIEAKLFLDIEPRHWLQYAFCPGKKDPHTDFVVRFNQVSNHLADWVVSLILCHEKPKARAKQMEKLVEIAQKLRTLNNYSALRAFVAGINNSTFPGDETMEHFKAKSPDHAKNLQSWDLLFQHIRAHRAYRMALKNTKGACIPALEVHMSDLIRAHEGNPDSNPNYPTKVHWGKFNMIGKFISCTTECQVQCRTTNDYEFPERFAIRELVFGEKPMSAEMQKSRIAPPNETEGLEDIYRPSFPRTILHDDSNTGQTKDVALLRKLFFW